jgi:hypothetical protein
MERDREARVPGQAGDEDDAGPRRRKTPGPRPRPGKRARKVRNGGSARVAVAVAAGAVARAVARVVDEETPTGGESLFYSRPAPAEERGC